MKKTAIAYRTVLLLLFFLSSMCYPLFHVQPHAHEATHGDGVWMHVDTFISQPDLIVEQYADALVRANIETIFILGKKIDGSVNFTSSHALKQAFPSDPMMRLTRILKSRNRKIFFYFPVNTDPAWNAAHPEDIAWQYGNYQQKKAIQDPEKKLVNLSSQRYREYILRLCEDALKRYDLDGIQLDYIRYRNGHWGFSPQENAKALERGINIEKIQELSYMTFVRPADWKTLLNRYDEKDPDVLAWVKMREDIIVDFAQSISTVVKKSNKQFSVTLVHSGATKSAYGAIHFSQSYPRLSSISDIAVPMAYHGSHPRVDELVQSVITGAKDQIAPSCRMMIGLQAYETSNHAMNTAILTAKKNQLNFVLFRVGTFSFAHLDIISPHPETYHLTATLNHTIPNHTIQGFEVRGLGGVLSMEENCWEHDQCSFDDGFKIWGKVFINTLGTTDIMIPLTGNWDLINGMLQPVVILADAQKDLPTYTTTAFSMEHYILCPGSGTIRSHCDPPIPARTINQNGTVLLHADDLAIFGYKVILDASRQVVLVKKHDRAFTFDYKAQQIGIEYFPSAKTMIYPNAFQLNAFPWLPLRNFFEITSHMVIYNARTKEIHCLSLQRVGDFTVNIDQYQAWTESCWLWNAPNMSRISGRDFFSVDFYSLLSAFHQKGRTVILQIDEKDFSYQQGETLMWMMSKKASPWHQVDAWKWRPSS